VKPSIQALTIAPQTDHSFFEEHFRSLGISSDRPRVVVHSKIWAFGKILGGVETIHAALLKVLGENATIVVPTYTVSLTENDVYDPDITPADSMGSYSDFFLKLPERTRSLCPIHNHAAIGAEAMALRQFADGSCSLGPGSDFEWLYKADFDLLLLGCSFAEGATYLHHLEAMAKIPYRKWTNLKRTLAGEGGKRSLLNVRYFARSDKMLIENFSKIENSLVKKGEVRKVPAPYGASLCTPIRKLHTLVVDELKSDPYFLVTRKERAPN
jgi:aminoglycoside N3'-acetyltransferase